MRLFSSVVCPWLWVIAYNNPVLCVHAVYISCRVPRYSVLRLWVLVGFSRRRRVAQPGRSSGRTSTAIFKPFDGLTIPDGTRVACDDAVVRFTRRKKRHKAARDESNTGRMVRTHARCSAGKRTTRTPERGSERTNTNVANTAFELENPPLFARIHSSLTPHLISSPSPAPSISEMVGPVPSQPTKTPQTDP